MGLSQILLRVSKIEALSRSCIGGEVTAEQQTIQRHWFMGRVQCECRRKGSDLEIPRGRQTALQVADGAMKVLLRQAGAAVESHYFG